ncbi:MOSC domain-containing protein [Pedococcus sp. NPDC057267]|uniref:MOSC domain-containing protein n=1 Tax=Pedococcus sp. NPDC057267 TaxID=3346077 RepID=UPI0036382584
MSEVGSNGSGRLEVVALQRFPVKATGAQACTRVEVDARGLVGDRGFAVYDAAGKMASGKHSRRFRRMDPVFELESWFTDDDDIVRLRLPDGTTVTAGSPEADDRLSRLFGEPVVVRAEAATPHFDAGSVSVVGTATLAELGRHEGDGRPLDPRHLRANVVVATTEPYAEDAWVGSELTVGGVRLRVLEPIERCRMVGVAQVDLPARPGMLKAVSDRHDLCAGVYAQVVEPGTIAVGDIVHLG